MESSDTRSRFATSVRRWRNRRGFSQEELAERANLHRTYISDVERGARNLSLESINKLAMALEVSVPILFSNAEELTNGDTAQGSMAMMPSSSFVNVLLVEDNPDDVTLTLEAFKRARFVNTVHVARDGAEALERLFGKAGIAEEPAAGRNWIILLDLELPKVKGMEILRRLKADMRTAAIPVVLLTASDNAQDIAASQKLGATAYITKPVDLYGLSRVTPELCLVWALIKPGIGTDFAPQRFG